MSMVHVNPISPSDLKRVEEYDESMRLRYLVLDELCKILNEQLIKKSKLNENRNFIEIDVGVVDRELRKRTRRILKKYAPKSWKRDKDFECLVDGHVVNADEIYFWERCAPAYYAVGWKVSAHFIADTGTWFFKRREGY